MRYCYVIEANNIKTGVNVVLGVSLTHELATRFQDEINKKVPGVYVDFRIYSRRVINGRTALKAIVNVVREINYG